MTYVYLFATGAALIGGSIWVRARYNRLLYENTQQQYELFPPDG